jgi:hypothetical protein
MVHMNEQLVTIHFVGQATVIGGLRVRAMGLEPIYTNSNEIATTMQATEEQYRDALTMFNSGEPVYL